MRSLWVSVMPAVFAGGCSLIYNPSNIDRLRDASTNDGPREHDAFTTEDADIDAPMTFDADFSMLQLEKISPSTIYEGQGVNGARPALVVIRGHNISDTATVSITGGGAEIMPGTAVVSGNRDFILVPVTVGVNATDTGSLPLMVTVTQASSDPQTIPDQLTVTYLPQLTGVTSINTDSGLQPLYSEVDLGNVTFTGSNPAILRSTSKITIGNITINGADGSGSNGGAPGAGGCAGGNAGTTGQCDGYEGGGIGGANSNGGAGGGYGEDGTNAPGGATGGVHHGDPNIVKYVAGKTDTNRSGGGGGGGSSGGGGGGGGGGTVELTAGGNITAGTINANGGTGAKGSTFIGLTASGGGGGGSGGAVAIRSVSGTVTLAGATAKNGTGGAQGGSGSAGAAGAVGRIRIALPTAGAVPATMPAAHRGVSFVSTTPTIVETNKPALQLLGNPGDTVSGWLINHDGGYGMAEEQAKTFTTASLDIQGNLVGGHNTLCFTVEPAMPPGIPVIDPLADSCIDIVYLPPAVP